MTNTGKINPSRKNARRKPAHQERYLKLQPLLREKITSFCSREVQIVPQLRLSGNWLAAAGFSPYQYVRVTVQKGQLIIRAEHNEPS